ncbi:MAG: hypothetical protein WDO74_27100 [Pseudomonadota bacterium]
MIMKPMFVSIGLSLALCVACGGSSDGSGSSGGSGGSGPVGGPGGSSPGGSGPGGSGGTPGTSAGNFSSGIPGDKQLGSLTDQEFSALCQKLDDYFTDGPVGKSVQEFSCRFSGALLAAISSPKTDAALQASCKTIYDQCIASPTTSTVTCTKPDATCTATAAEYDVCVNDMTASVSKLENTLPSCDKLTLASQGTIGTGATPETPASCTAVRAKCPTAPMPSAMGGDDAGSP